MSMNRRSMLKRLTAGFAALGLSRCITPDPLPAQRPVWVPVQDPRQRGDPQTFTGLVPDARYDQGYDGDVFLVCTVGEPHASRFFKAFQHRTSVSIETIDIDIDDFTRYGRYTVDSYDWNWQYGHRDPTMRVVLRRVAPRGTYTYVRQTPLPTLQWKELDGFVLDADQSGLL